MRKIYLLFTALIISTALFSQDTNDSVTLGPGYSNAIFYSMENGIQSTAAIKNSDIQIRFEGRSASIRTVDGWGAQTYLPVMNDTTQWSILDTTGMALVGNSDTAWENGAFNTTSTGHPSYGWGSYNNINHNIYGTKLFVIKTQLGNYKKVWIKMLNTVPKIYTIRYANLDGSMDTTVDIGAADFSGQNFGYYCFDNHSKQTAEPTDSTWNIVFRKYDRSIDNYPVVGVLTNLHVKSAEARNLADPYTTTGSGLLYVDDISNIGSDWKNFPPPSGPWALEDSLAYFVLTQQGQIWRIIFTGFGGSSTGKIMFAKKLVYDATGIENTNQNINSATIYPNPSQANSVLLFISRSTVATNIEIFSLDGQCVHHEVFPANNGINQFPIGSIALNKGMYIVQISDGVEKINVKLLVSN